MKLALLLRISGWMALLTVPLLASCGGDDEAAPGGAAGVSFHGEVSPLADFSQDTGLQPPGGPAQVQLSLKARGTYTVDAEGVVAGGKLTAKPGSGHAKLDLHFALEGQAKATTALASYDGDIPGLKDIDIPITGEVAFEPFLVKEGETSLLTANIPETKLPEIPLGSVPGKLQLTVAAGSALTSTFRGTCVSVAGGKASYVGDVKMGGRLVIKATVKLDLPAPLDTPFDLPDLEVAMPDAVKAVDLGSASAQGAADATEGTSCRGPDGDPPSKPEAPDGGGTDGGTDGGGTTPAPASITVVVDGETMKVGQVKLAVEAAEYGQWTSARMPVSGTGIPAGTTLLIGAAEVAKGCSHVGNYVLLLMPDDHHYASSNGAACGLEIKAVPKLNETGGRFSGTFHGTAEDPDSPATKQIYVTFDLPRP